MKKLLAVMAAGCVLSLVVVVGGHAQDPGSSIRINDEPTALVIQKVGNRREEAIFQTEPLDARRIPNHSLLIFHRYGDTSFLSEVLTAGEQTGEQLRPTHAERTLRIEMAKNNVQPETVTVAMN